VAHSSNLQSAAVTSYPADLAAVHAARDRIAGGVHRTPVFTCSAIDALAGRRVHLKAENLQRTGSFKMRGALNAVLKLPDDVAARGVVTHSSGNFAQALALSARLRGVPAHIVMPSNAPSIKQAAVAGYGARIILCEPTQAAREATADAVQAETGGTLLHPYDHPDVIAGQGTMGLELLEQVPGLSAVVAPVGGGGMVAGIALALAEAAPDVPVFAAEPHGADDAARSLAAGRRLPQTDPNTLADGLRTGLGELTWPVVRDVVAGLHLVTEQQIVDAMRLIWQRAKLVVEPSGAVALAAVLSEGFKDVPGADVAVILSGGNVDLGALPFG
jgi:threonine dehydratase